jgi:hypothetical protein
MKLGNALLEASHQLMARRVTRIPASKPSTPAVACDMDSQKNGFIPKLAEIVTIDESFCVRLHVWEYGREDGCELRHET